MTNIPRDEVYCTKCGAEGVKTLLFYSMPAKPADTWTKKREKKSDYRCKDHVKRDNNMYHSTKGKSEHKRRTEAIQDYRAKRIRTFHELWHDNMILDKDGNSVIKLPNPEHMMWILIRKDIRTGQQGYAVDEITEVTREGQIEFSPNAETKKFLEGAKDRGIPLAVREQMEDEVFRLYRDVKEAMQEVRRRHFLNLTRGEIEQANKLWDRRDPDDIEKIVTTPGHRDPEGNSVQRYHLLTRDETLLRRQSKKRKQQQQIENTIEREKQIKEAVEKRLREKSGSDSESETSTQ